MSTRLDSATLAELREQADRAAGPFLDPAVFRRVQGWVPPAHDEWATAILGHDWPGFRHASNRDLVLLDLAHAAEPDPPPSAAQMAARARAEQDRAELVDRRRRAWAAWVAVRDALPVPVHVAHNYTSGRHYENYVQGVDHILVAEPLHVGRLHREPGQPLCWAPSRAHHLAHFSAPYDDRIPDCRACQRVAARLIA